MEDDVKSAVIESLRERQKFRDALVELLAFWDRKDDHGWTPAETKRIEEIRKLVK